jgi:hypothetical protein
VNDGREPPGAGKGRRAPPDVSGRARRAVAAPRRRKGRVKGSGTAVRDPSTAAASGRNRGFLETSLFRRTSSQELTMADVAFVVITLAVFALVALVAKGVTKL